MLDLTLDCSTLKVSDLCYAQKKPDDGFVIINVQEKPNMVSDDGNLIIRLINVSDEIKDYIKSNSKNSYVNIGEGVEIQDKFKVINVYVNGDKIYGS